MTYRQLGRSGLEVSTIGFGGASLAGIYGQVDERQAEATVQLAVDRGVTLFDTADIYGDGAGERLLAQGLAGRRDEVVLASKFGLVRGRPDVFPAADVRGDPAYVRLACDRSLERLRTDRIDLYFLHRPDPAVPIEETVGAMAGLVAQGKVRYLGLSEASVDTLTRAHRVHPIAALQSEWSLWSRDIEQRIVPAARSLGTGIVAYSPLGRGFLTGAVQSPASLEERRLDGDPRLAGPNLARNHAMVRSLEQIASTHGCTPGQLALAWVLARGDDVVPIPGTKRTSYLEENLGALGLHLDGSELQRLEQAVDASQVAGDRRPDMGSVDVSTPPLAFPR